MIPSEPTTNAMDPMDDAALQAYAEVIVSHMDENGLISPEGMEFLHAEGNMPCAEDQIKIITLQEEIYNAKNGESNTEESTAEVSEEDTSEIAAEEAAEVAEEATSEAEPVAEGS